MSDLRGVIVSHAAVGESLVAAVKSITGIADALVPVSNDGCDYDALEKKLAAVLDRPAVLFIDLPGGDVDIHVLSANGIVNFTPDMQLAIQAQYDNISENFGFLGRFRWEFRPGSEIFIALGQSALIPGQAFRAQATQFSFRIGHTLQF
jgi:hypothetical protein